MAVTHSFFRLYYQGSFQISQVGDEVPSNFNDMVQDNFQMLLQVIPSIKHNITEAVDQLPGIREQISQNIDMLPSKDDIKDKTEDWRLGALGLVVADDDIDDMLSTLDSLPSKDYIDENIQMALDNIPSSDYINNMVDEFVDQ